LKRGGERGGKEGNGMAGGEREERIDIKKEDV
jgi:hypothetical protein